MNKSTNQVFETPRRIGVLNKKLFGKPWFGKVFFSIFARTVRRQSAPLRENKRASVKPKRLRIFGKREKRETAAWQNELCNRSAVMAVEKAKERDTI